MKRVLEFLKEHKYLMVLLIIVGFSVTLGLTYSNFIVTSNNHKAAEIYIGALKYSIEINESSTNTLSVPTGETIIDVKVNNQNPVDTYYKLLYLNNSNLIVEYFGLASELDDSNNVTKSYDKPNDSVTSSNSKTIKLKITNNGTSSQNLSLSVKGGYITNTLSDITIPSTYSEIASINAKASTYFCKTNDTLTQGLQYVNGQYTYAYKQEGYYASSGLDWSNINNNSWGIQLTDKTSTDAVTSKVCTYINNKPITSMSYMFSSSQATTIDLSSFDTSKVTNMEVMFGDSQATTLDVSNFDTSKVTNMKNMFMRSEATTLDLSNFNTSNVISMYGMFSGSHATTLDLSSFDTSKVTNMVGMFFESQVKTLDLSNFDTSNVTDMSSMFLQSLIEEIKGLNNFDTSNVVDMEIMFANTLMTTLDLSSFNTSKVTYMSSMFSGSHATTLDLSSFDTSKVIYMSEMFSGSQATTLDLSNFDTSKVTNMSQMFSYSKATVLDLGSFDTNNVTNMNKIFYANTNLKTIYASDKFNTAAVTDSTNMFKNCTSLVGGSGTVYNSTKVDKTYARIDGGTSYPGYFTDVKDKPSTFGTDDWATVVSSVKAGNSRGYKVGDTKEIDLGTTYGTHTIRIANTSTPSECSTTGFSQTACGFVLEFADTITENKMNNKGGLKGTNVGGWPATSMRTFINNDIYNSLPKDLKNGIINTTVVSGHGSEDTTNFTSIDKLYLLSTAEIWAQGTSNKITSDSARNMTRQLDYYKAQGTSTDNYSAAIKKHDTIKNYWGLRSSSSNSNFAFHYVTSSGNHNGDNGLTGSIGVSPAFRIG